MVLISDTIPKEIGEGVSKHDKTLAAVKDVAGNLKWKAIEAMLKHFGAKISERRGSRIAVELNGFVAIFHRPHPSPDAGKGRVRDVKDFIERAGL